MMRAQFHIAAGGRDRLGRRGIPQVRAVKIRATEEMLAATVPSSAGCAQRCPRPLKRRCVARYLPELPDQPACVEKGLLDQARERVAEARDALSHGTTQTLDAATQTAALLHTWCGG